MATHRLFIPATAFLPDSSVYPQPNTIDMSNDRFGTEMLVFPDTGTRIVASAIFQVPANYVGTPKVQIIWYANATTGAVVWDIDTKAVAVAESLDPSTDDDALTVTTTTAGTAFLRNESEVTPSGTYVAEDMVLIKVARDGVQGADTLATGAMLVGVAFEYADA